MLNTARGICLSIWRKYVLIYSDIYCPMKISFTFSTRCTILLNILLCRAIWYLHRNPFAMHRIARIASSQKPNNLRSLELTGSCVLNMQIKLNIYCCEMWESHIHSKSYAFDFIGRKTKEMKTLLIPQKYRLIYWYYIRRYVHYLLLAIDFLLRECYIAGSFYIGIFLRCKN